MKISTRSFVKVSVSRGKNDGWSGANVTSNAFGTDTIEGQPFGISEFGGIDHFRNRVKYTPSH